MIRIAALRSVFAVAVVMVALSGCASPGEMKMATELGSGRYGKIIRDFEADGGYAALEPGGVGFSRLAGVCEAYFRLRDHVNYATCSQRLATLPIPASHQGNVSDMSMNGMFLVRKAMLAIELGDFQQAQDYAQEAVPLVEEGSEYNHYELIRAYRAAGIAAALLHDDQLAETYVKKVKGVHYDFSGMDRELTSFRRLGSAAIYTAQKNYPGVIHAFEAPDDSDVDIFRVLDAITTLGLSEVIEAVMEEALSDWHNFETFPLGYMYAKALYETGRIDPARQAYDEALASPIAPNFGAIYYSILADRGRIAEADGDIDAAIAYLRRAVEEIERRRQSLHSEASKIGYVGDKQTIYADLIRLLIQRGRATEAFEYAERGKARALVDLLAARDDLGAGRRNAARLDSLLGELNRAESIQSADPDALANPAVSRGLEYSKQRLINEAPEFASLVTVSSESAAVTQGRLGADEQLIEYFYQADAGLFVAFVVDRGGIEAVLFDGDGLDSDIRALRKAVQDPTNQDWRRWSEVLYRRLLEPLEAKLTARNLTIVPHGALHYLPFNVLSSGERLLVEDYRLRLLPSAAVLAFLDKPRQADESLMAYGNPDLGNPSYALPGAEAEAAAIAELWQGARLFVGRAASETHFKKSAEYFQVVHLATHGQFRADAPMESRILLAPDGENDGNLTVPEIYGLRLNADLVTLSACETGLGEVAGGDDVIGLTRGFLYAGARTIVSSLWRVPDQATKELMMAFYANLKAGMNKVTAMQLAQNQVRAKYPHPVYWAAFQVTGGA